MTWNTRIEPTALAVATVEFNRAQEDLIDACGDVQEGGKPNFAPIHDRLNAAIEAIGECGVDPYEEAREGIDYWKCKLVLEYVMFT